MADKSTYIKLDRNITRWRWWHDHNTLIVFLVLLINANIQEHGFSGLKIRRGEVACSFSTISQQANLTVQQVRTAFLHLKLTGEITSKRYNKFQVVTIVNYDKYQDSTRKTTDKQHSDNNQSTFNQQQLKKYKNGKNGKKKVADAPAPSGTPPRGTDAFRAKSHLLLTEDEGTADDIPVDYREDFKTFSEYWRYRNQ